MNSKKKQTKKTNLKSDSNKDLEKIRKKTEKDIEEMNITNKKEPNSQKIKSYKYSDYMSNFSIQKWKEKLTKQTKKNRMFLVVMQMRNGKISMFTIATTETYFVYLKGLYYIDPDMIREDIHSGLNMLYYHQDCTMPFKIEFNIRDLKDKLARDEDESEVEKIINPKNLGSFINSQIIEKVLKGQELSDDIKMLRTLLIINLLVTFGLLVMIGRSMGFF